MANVIFMTESHTERLQSRLRHWRQKASVAWVLQHAPWGTA